MALRALLLTTPLAAAIAALSTPAFPQGSRVQLSQAGVPADPTGDWSPDSPCRSTSFRLRFAPGRFALLDGAERTAEFEVEMTQGAGGRIEMRIARVAFASAKLQPGTIPSPGTVMVLELSGGRLSVVETQLPTGAVVRPQNLSAYARCE